MELLRSNVKYIIQYEDKYAVTKYVLGNYVLELTRERARASFYDSIVQCHAWTSIFKEYGYDIANVKIIEVNVDELL